MCIMKRELLFLLYKYPDFEAAVSESEARATDVLIPRLANPKQRGVILRMQPIWADGVVTLVCGLLQLAFDLAGAIGNYNDHVDIVQESTSKARTMTNVAFTDEWEEESRRWEMA